VPEDEVTPFRAPAEPEQAEVETVMAVDPTPPSQTLIERLIELEGDAVTEQPGAAEGEAGPPAAPKKAAKKAPATPAAATTPAVEDAAGLPVPAGPVPVEAPTGEPVVPAPTRPHLPPPRLAVPGASPAPAYLQERRWPRSVRVLVTLTVLLLAAAAALGAAGLVRSEYQTWRSTSAVRVQGATVQPTASDLTRFAVHVAYSTDSVRAAAAVPPDDVRDDLAGKAVAPDQVVITASARGSEQAEQLAQSGAEALQVWITEDQLKQAVTPEARLDAAIVRPPTKAELSLETQRLMAGAAGLAAGVVLLLALLVHRRVRRRARD
jgi:hypothetical protein